MPVPISPGLPRKQASHGALVFRMRRPVARTRSSMNHSMQNPIALCNTANGPLRSARDEAGALPAGMPVEGRDGWDSEAMGEYSYVRSFERRPNLYAR